MTDGSHSVPPDVRDEVVETEAFCPGCGYNVRGLSRSAKCPECATPVWTALSEQLLAYADPAWLETLGGGTRWLSIALGVMAVSAGVRWLVGYLLSEDAKHAVFLVGITVAAACVFWGVWRITTLNPADLGREPPGSPRRIARVAMLIGLIDVALTVALWQTAVGPGILIALNVLASPVGVAGAIAAWGLTRHFETMARRADDDFAARRALLYRRGFLVSWTVGALCSLMAAAGAAPVACLLLPAGCSLLGFGVLILLMPMYLAGRLKESLTRARALRDRRIAEPGAFR